MFSSIEKRAKRKSRHQTQKTLNKNKKVYNNPTRELGETIKGHNINEYNRNRSLLQTIVLQSEVRNCQYRQYRRVNKISLGFIVFLLGY